ncbi:para-nitrobenzyl esterase [Novosphingobium sp. PhB165]|uniref:carboxylesterase/lipase family protein n=1 Tax=Novosphingobium sp. PhB165 TaxID=2485105 RepID=UPI0010E8D4AF|nr:carboxylesterase family protein [Novosphingobium sp. PhB165]TCM17162.1 para-nitrobenzyl esterase [Novosphingobium sp. PhB165]
MTEIVIEMRSGAVSGVGQPGLTRFLGIPYAKAGRFEVPGPVPPWQGVRAADRFGRQCPQQFGGKVRRDVLESEVYGEDCLYLNVYCPEGGAPEGGVGGPKPVMVWIHGGAFLAGGANSYDASRLAREGDIVVVTINYRIGVLGFVNFGDALGIPAIPSNLGLRDQIAALEWVRDNIADFGGDPGKVTICGQSAGSMSVSLLLLSPLARGLFHSAVMQSGAVSLIHDRDRSIRDARRFAEVLGLDQSSLQRLRTMDIAELMEGQTAVGKQLKNAIPAAPWYDGDVLPASFEAALATPAAPVPLLAGATRDEVRLFDVMPGDILPTKWPDLEALLHDQFGPEQAARILAAYPRSRKGRIALGSDLTFMMPTRHFAERHARHSPTWFYRFDYSHPLVGPTHGLDLTVFWPFRGLKMALVRGGPDSGRRAELGRRMRSHVAHFVRHGDPGDMWPRYEETARKVRIYDLADRFEANPEAERYAVWAGRDVEPGRGK